MPPTPEPPAYAVLHVPFYRLQCALVKRAFDRASREDLASRRPPDALDRWAGWSAAELRALDDARDRTPAALLDDEGKGVVELNGPAQAAGVPVGVGTSLAVARAPGLFCVPRAHLWEERLQDALLHAALGHTPLLESTAPGVCTLDLRTRRRATDDDAGWMQALLDAVHRLGLRAQAGFGPNPEVARQAAQLGNPILSVDSRGAGLRALPLTALDPAPELAAILETWGVRDSDALARLPRAAVGARLGVEGLALWDRAAGRGGRALRLARPPERFVEAIELEFPLETLEPLQFLLRRFLERLCFRVETSYRLVAELRLTLPLEGSASVKRTLPIPAPTCDVEALFRIVTQYLETVQTAAPVLGFTLEATPSDPGNCQFDLYQGGLKDPNRFFQTLGRLVALLGEDAVGIPEPLDTHRPDGVRLRWPDFQWTEPSAGEAEKPASPPLGPALRRCRPGVPAEVVLAEGVPTRLGSALASGDVREVRGPWKLSGDWWDQGFWGVEEWDVQLEGGGLYRLMREGDLWHVAGTYD